MRFWTTDRFYNDFFNRLTGLGNQQLVPIANPGEGQRVSLVTVPTRPACEQLEPLIAVPGTWNEHECGHGRASLILATMK